MEQLILIILGTIQAITIAAIPIYGAYITKRLERDGDVEIARIENSDDVAAAQSKVQIEYAESYKLLAAEARESIIEAKKAKEELRQLREYVNKLEKRVVELEEDGKRKDKLIADLQAAEKKKDREIKSLRTRLARIKGELDTGPLDTGSDK